MINQKSVEDRSGKKKEKKKRKSKYDGSYSKLEHTRLLGVLSCSAHLVSPNQEAHPATDPIRLRGASEPAALFPISHSIIKMRY